MKKPKEPPDLKKTQVQQVHPQVERTDVSDAMSTQTQLHITIPLLGGDLDGILDAIRDNTTDKTITKWEDLQELVHFDRFESTEDGMRSASDVLFKSTADDPLSDEAFKRRAYQLLKHALENLPELTQVQTRQVLDNFAPFVAKAGMALAEARMRNAHYYDVAVRKQLRKRFSEQAAVEAEEHRKRASSIIKTIDKFRAKGHSISRSARLAFEKGKEGSSAEANRQLYYRRGGNKKL